MTRRLRRRTLDALVYGLAVGAAGALAGCSGPSDGAPPPPAAVTGSPSATGPSGARGTDAAEPADLADSADSALDDLRRAVLATPPGEEIPPGPLSRVQNLPPARRLAVARALARGDDPRLSILGGSLLLDLGRPDEADRAFTAAVLAGADLTGLFFGWLHGDDPDRALRRYVGISRRLLERLDELPPAERDRADRFLCDASLGKRLEECSPEAVRARLLRIEADLNSRPEEEP